VINIFNWHSRGGGGVQLGPLGTAAPDDYDDGEIGGMIDRGNRNTLGENLPQCRFTHHEAYMLPGREPGPPRLGSQRLTA
jgi:hypothetical protein